MTSYARWLPPKWLAWILSGLFLTAIAYAAWWWYAAELLANALTDFRTQAAAQGVHANWRSVSTSGFPLRLRAMLDAPRYEDKRTSLAWEARGLTIEVLPWSVAQFVLAAEGPQSLRLGPSLTLAGEAKQSGVSLLFRGDGVPKQLDIAAKDADATLRQLGVPDVSVKGETLGLHWRIDPMDADTKDGRDYEAAANGTALTLTGITLPFGPDIADVKVQVTLRSVPALQGIDGAMDLAQWRTKGAPLTIRTLSFVSGGVDVKGQGDLALDADGVLQGQLNLSIGGLDKIVALLSKNGAIPEQAKSTLFVTSTMLSATGAKVPMPLVFKDGKTYLGPAEIGPAPRLVF